MKILLVWSSADWSIIDVSRGYSDALRSLGHDVYDFRFNNRINFWNQSLKQWSATQGTPEPDIHSVLQFTSEWAVIEAAKFQADIVLITSAMGFHPDSLALLRYLNFPTGALLSEAPYDDRHHFRLAPLFDFMFVNDRGSTDELSKIHPRSFYVPTAYHADLHRPDRDPRYDNAGAELDHPYCDVLFVGTGFKERQEFLETVDWKGLGIDFQLYGFWGWNDVDEDNGYQNRLDSPLMPYAHEPITNDETASRYVGAKIVINMYRNGIGYSTNPRAYEIAACGAFQLAQDGAREAHEIFGDTIDYFTTPKELEDKIRYWLAPKNEVERLAKALAARDRVLDRHSYRQRALQVVDIINQHIDLGPRQAAPTSISAFTNGDKLAFGSPLTFGDRQA